MSYIITGRASARDVAAMRRADERLRKQEERQAKIDGRNKTLTVQEFWDRVNTSAGVDECHPWTGELNSTWSKYTFGEAPVEGCGTKLAHRVVCFLTFGREPPKSIDIIPSCSNRICCNVDHLMVRPHNSHDASLDIPVRRFYAEGVFDDEAA